MIRDYVSIGSKNNIGNGGCGGMVSVFLIGVILVGWYFV